MYTKTSKVRPIKGRKGYVYPVHDTDMKSGVLAKEKSQEFG